VQAAHAVAVPEQGGGLDEVLLEGGARGRVVAVERDQPLGQRGDPELVEQPVQGGPDAVSGPDRRAERAPVEGLERPYGGPEPGLALLDPPAQRGQRGIAALCAE